MAYDTRFQKTIQQFLSILGEVQKERASRQTYTDVVIRGRIYKEPSWLVFEVETMLSAINKILVSEGRTKATAEELWWAEGFAKGHSDYSSKFALYCAELACPKEQ